jgi:hypothetical protein
MLVVVVVVVVEMRAFPKSNSLENLQVQLTLLATTAYK